MLLMGGPGNRWRTMMSLIHCPPFLEKADFTQAAVLQDGGGLDSMAIDGL